MYKQLKGYSYIFLTSLIIALTGCAQFGPVDLITSPKTPANCLTPTCLPETYTRHFPPIIPTAIPQGLPVPTFTQASGSINYGGKIPLSAPGIPTGAVFEYSYNKGKTWTIGGEVPILSKDTVLARTRINNLVSEPAAANYSLYFKRMLVIGNSIMSHAPYPEVGWYNNNGMAASAPEKDFVHLLNGYLKTLYPEVSYQLQTGGNFERQFGAPGYSIDEFNSILQEFKPDLIIVRIGENVDEGDVFSRNFELQFRNLVDRLATYSDQPAKIVCSTSVWNRPQTDIAIRRVAQEKGLALADLSEIVPQSKYFATQYANPSVAAHPNDLGMQRIADLIWKQIP